MNNKKIRIMAGTLALLASTTITLSGCKAELAPTENYDIVDNTDEGKNLDCGLKQVLEVPGQSFKLIAEYSCDASSKREWRITSDKFLYLNVCTEGLSKDTVVYIDNIHIDTSIKSKYAIVDGIIQDTMDDHVHSSQMKGFYIDDNSKYFGVNAIEGCNENFLKMSGYGYNGYYAVSGEQKRRLESDYIDMGVYANKIQVVYDLLVKGVNDEDFTNVSVSTDFLVPVTSVMTKDELPKQKVK